MRSELPAGTWPEPTPRDRPCSPSSPIVVIGETLIDIVPNPEDPASTRELPGGSCANVAVTLGRLDRDVTLVTTLAGDDRGQAARTWLEDSNVRVIASRPSTGRTSTATATLDQDGAATYAFDLTWDLPTPVVDNSLAGDAGIIHVGSIATVLPPGADAVKRALSLASGRALVSFDPNARPTITPDLRAARERVERLVGLSDLVKVSDEDLAWYYPDTDPRDAARAWADFGPALVVVTFGSRGCLLVHRGHAIDVPSRQVNVADTIGAGDTFTGALLDALMALGVSGEGGRDALADLDSSSVRVAANWAVSAAAVTVSRPGADPPRRSELLHLRRR